MIKATLHGGPFDGETITVMDAIERITMYPDGIESEPSFYVRTSLVPGKVARYEWAVAAPTPADTEKHKYATDLLAGLMESHVKALHTTGSIQQAAASLRSELESALLEEFHKGYGK